MSLKRSRRARNFNFASLIGWMGAGVGTIVALLSVFAPGVLAKQVGFVTGTNPSVEGMLHVSGDDLGVWELAPNTCRSGESFGFHGVILFHDNDESKQVRLARKPAGDYTVTARIPGTDDAVVFNDCELMDIQVSRTNTQVNMIWAVEGSAKISCETLKGDLSFSNCH